MAERRQQSCLRGSPRNMGPAATAGSVPLTTPQWCTHRPGVKYVQANACPCRSTNHPCTSGFLSKNCRNQGPTRAPTAPTLTTYVRKNIEEAQESAPTLCHTTPLVVFHQDASAFFPNVLPIWEEWPALLTRANTNHATPALTETVAPDPAALAAGGIGKINSNCAWPKDGQTASPSLPAWSIQWCHISGNYCRE